jgi:hypothetical protein
MPQSSFTAQINAWVAKAEARIEAVRKESAQRVIEVMQTPVAAGGNMPVSTGFLRASLVVSTAPVLQNRENPGASVTYDAGATSLAIAGSAPADVIYATYGANYASAQEYGTRGRQGRRFVALAAQQWPAIVNTVAAEVVAKTGG